MLRVRQRALGFVAARKGSVHGRLVIRRDGEVSDFAQAGTAGNSPPRFPESFDIVSSDAKVIVILEKDSIANRLAQQRWWDDARCIMVCSGGFPSMSARELVRKLIDTLGIPAVVFADADPAGIRVALTFAHGSISSALETPWLASHGVSWAGFWPSDFASQCTKRDFIRLDEEDRDEARGMLADPSHTYLNDRVRDELATLREHGHKVELDTLTHGPTRLVDYMNRKLSDGDLIRL